MNTILRIWRMSRFSFGYNEPFVDQLIYFIWNSTYFCSKITGKCKFIFSAVSRLLGVFREDFNKYFTIAENEKFIVDGERERFYKSLSPSNPKAKELLEIGFVNTEISFDHISDEVVKIVKSSACWNSQVPIQASSLIPALNEFERDQNYYSLPPDNVELTPYYQVVLGDQKIREIVSDYFGCETYLYSINTMRSFPAVNGKSHDVTNIHRDFDDIGFISLFVYWTPISVTGGTTKIAPTSHRNPDNCTISKEFLALEGERGQAWLVDPFTLHHGSPPTSGERIVTWFRFARDKKNLAHYQDKSKFFDDSFRKLWK